MQDMLIKAAQSDAALIVSKALGWDLRIMRPKMYHAKGVPTYWGALVLADEEGIAITREDIKAVEIKRAPEDKRAWQRIWLNSDCVPVTEARAFVWVTGGTMAGAGISRDPIWHREIAQGMAFRAAVEKRLFGEIMTERRTS